MGMLSWLRSRGIARRAIGAMQQGRLREAVDAFEKLVEVRPRDWQAWCGLGECDAALGDLNAAEHAFRRCLELDPESVEAKEGLALTYGERDRDWQRCLDMLEGVLPIGVDAGVAEFMQIDIAWVHHLRGDAVEAAEHFDSALGEIEAWESKGVEEDAQFAATEYRVGALYYALRSDAPRAVEHLRKAARLSPESVYAREARQLMDSIPHTGELPAESAG